MRPLRRREPGHATVLDGELGLKLGNALPQALDLRQHPRLRRPAVLETRQHLEQHDARERDGVDQAALGGLSPAGGNWDLYLAHGGEAYTSGTQTTDL